MLVCMACATNPHLKTCIDANGVQGACGFCGSEGQPVVPVAGFVDHVGSVIRRPEPSPHP